MTLWLQSSVREKKWRTFYAMPNIVIDYKCLLEQFIHQYLYLFQTDKQNSDLFAEHKRCMLTHVSAILNQEEEKAKERWCLFVLFKRWRHHSLSKLLPLNCPNNCANQTLPTAMYTRVSIWTIKYLWLFTKNNIAIMNMWNKVHGLQKISLQAGN